MAPLPTFLQSTTPKSNYFPHLDGLRVLFLLGVFLFHFDYPAPGGFIGVDCFLVLSGFLITRNILRQISNHTFTFRDFYVRRFWRLYPASFTVAFVTVLFSVLLFPPDFAINAINSALASAGLASNIHFLTITDYFDDGAHLKPLLHTWSLSLEEQFYLFWPFVLGLITSTFSNSKTLLSLLITVLAAISAGLSYLLQPNHASFVFFMLPTRIFEFAVGTLCALTEENWYVDKPTASRKTVDTTVSIVAVFIIFASYFYMPTQPPPHQVMIVLLAVASFIMAPNSYISKIVFGNPLSQFLGSLTYSAYLTHWPIYVFCRYIFDGFHIPRLGGIVLSFASFALAFLLQVSIENPLRKKRASYLPHLTIAMISFFAFCICIRVANHHGYNVNPDTSDQNDVRKYCIDYGRGWVSGTDGCQTGDLTGPYGNVSIVGDSYAGALIPAFHALGKRRGIKFTFVFFHGCQLRPLGYKDQGSEKCAKHTRIRWKKLAGEPTNGAIVIPRNSTIVLSHWSRAGDQEARNEKILGVYKELRELGHKMVLVSSPPGVHPSERWRNACNDVRKTALMKMMHRIGFPLSHTKCVDKWISPHPASLRTIFEYRKSMKDLKLRDLKFIDLFKELCDGKENLKCRTLWDFDSWKGVPELGYRRDGHHIARSGSLFVSRIFEKHLFR